MRGSMPYLIDFEASGLAAASYPIQVAWRTPGGEVEMHYIRPEPDWMHWDTFAEELHNIPRQLLFDVGRVPSWVARRMNQALEGVAVYCDGGMMDRHWCRRLFDAARVEPAFELRSFFALVDHVDPNTEAFAALDEQAWREAPGLRHQADVDVEQLAILYRLLPDAAIRTP